MTVTPSLSKTSDERDARILQHVARYRLTTNEVLHRAFFSHALPNAVVKITNRLVQTGLLCKFPLVHPQVYFTLSDLAAKRLGLGSHRCLPLGPQALATELATLLYCTAGQHKYLRLAPLEVHTRFPWLTATTKHDVFAVRHVECQVSSLQWIRTDLGGPSHHVVRKAMRRLRKWTGSPAVDTAIRDGNLSVVFLTPTPEKLQSVRAAIEHHDWPDGLSIHLAVIPQLLPLTTRYRHGA